MANIYDNDINKFTDWNGDNSTDNRPVSGRAVQKFIKDTLQSRIGYVYDDAANNRCLGFADESDYQLYTQDPIQYADLLIHSWYSYHPPVPQTLDYRAYYGTVDNQITPEQNITSLLSSTASLNATCSSSKEYVYVLLYSNYRLTRAMTANNEDVLSDFVKLNWNTTVNGQTYNIYELHADSGLPLDVNISLTFSKQ